MSATVELASSETVIRVVTKGGAFLPDESLLPTGEAFAPNEEDKAEAARSGNPVRVSVWDHRRTTIEQAQNLRNSVAPLVSFLLDVRHVLEVRESEGEARLRVVVDPLRESRGLPGEDGHCGIEGLDRPAGGAKKKYKAIRDRLATKVRRAASV